MAVSLESPYYDGPGAVWLRGNLHAHSTRSDGALSPQDVVDKYVALGYDFLMLSDHDTLGEPEALDGGKMMLICGNEVSASGPHILQVGASKKVEPYPDRQQVIDAINADGGLAILCHPNWQEHFNHFPYEQLLALKDYAGIEILNGTCILEPGDGKATDKWDRLLVTGKRVWGYGNDDVHRDGEMAMAWNVVRASERSVPAVIEALRNGSCYVSSGVEIREIRCTGSVLHVVAPNAQAMAVIGDGGARLHYALGNELEFDAAEVRGPYVRVECYGLGAEMAWTQPFFVHGGTAEYLEKLAAERPALKAARVDRPVAMTGKLDDPAWAKAEASTRFLSMSRGEPAAVETAVKCLVSKEHLYFGIRCSEPFMDKLKTNISRHGDPNTWSDDSVEIFVDAGASQSEYLHVMVSAAGFSYSTWMPAKGQAPAIQTAASRDSSGYTLEVAAPLSAFGDKAGPGREWGVHFCRNRKAKKATYLWAWVGRSNHNPKGYGRLVFGE